MLGCRGSISAAASLSRYSLPHLDSSSGVSQAAPCPITSLQSARLACRTAELLLLSTAAGLREGGQLEPAEVYRLVSCSAVAFGPAAEATQRAYIHAKSASMSERGQASMAASLGALCQTLLCAACRASDVVGVLEGRNPAAALSAAICSQRRASALCHQMAPVLLWCSERQGAA